MKIKCRQLKMLLWLTQLVEGELSGRLALDHLPLDNWAHHALAHNFEESGRPLQVRQV